MPTSPDLRTQLQAAATRLRAGGEPAPDLAEYVRKVLLPGGWKELRATDKESSEPNLTIRIARQYRDAVVAAAADQVVTLTSVVNEGYKKFLAGEFKTRDREKVRGQERRPTGEQKVNLNVTPNAALLAQVRDSGVLPMHVAGDYLMHYFKVGPYAPGYTEPLPSGSDRNPTMPRALRDKIRDRAAELGHPVHQDMNEGFQKYLAGEFTPAVPEWPKNAEMAILKVRPNNDLFDQVKVAARSKSPELRPIQIGLAYVMEKYGIDPTDTAAE
ncbi:hypothetical protein [[Kitasatospora] papulosa]|uniref:hypothetical protein n=1 Tax=[Kitasatospora] papulosa TaxID=1464011 RepID=UPI00367B810C